MVRKSYRGFTLVEMLTVLVILGTLIAAVSISALNILQKQKAKHDENLKKYLELQGEDFCFEHPDECGNDVDILDENTTDVELQTFQTKLKADYEDFSEIKRISKSYKLICEVCKGTVNELWKCEVIPRLDGNLKNSLEQQGEDFCSGHPTECPGKDVLGLNSFLNKLKADYEDFSKIKRISESYKLTCEVVSGTVNGLWKCEVTPRNKCEVTPINN